MVAVAVAFYLAADNHEFLECHLSHLEGAITRIILLSLALVVFLIVFIGFWVRKEGHCVQVKGKFEELSIEVMNNNERKIEMVFSENHTITHTIPPPLPPNSPKPNYNGCNENLYKDDFKGIIDYVKGQVTVHARTCMDDKCTCTYDAQHVMNCLQGINRAVGIRKLDNKVVMVYWIVENTSTTAVNHVYLVVQSTTDPAIHVYKVTEGLNNLSKCVKEENVEEPLLTYKYNNKEYEIYLYRHEDRKKMKFAVQIETPTP